jgi:chromosome segregation protein
VFLKSVELFGFKSFAEKTKIEFTDGISALLGPNGCGKSNVVDAIKWVLGEQATKSLRADKMEDVIFNGTESRKALNVAEVALTVHNETGILALDTPEITIKRRLYRNGESEYLLNNTPVRLKELRELFYDTGIGKSAYSIMEQGKIDQVLSNKPEERRHIFEEAAAITRFKVKGLEAERKLQRTEENMHQVENILTEVKRSYDSLKKQADKTARYRELKDELFQVELDIQLLKLRDLLEEKDKRSKELKVSETERDEIKQQIDGINEMVESNLDQVNSMESVLIENQKKLYGVDLEKNNAQAQIQLLEERKQELQSQLVRAKDQEAHLTQRIQQIQSSLEEKRKETDNQRQRLQEIHKNTKEFQTSISHTEHRIQENSNSIIDKQKKIDLTEIKIADLQSQLQAITEDIVVQLDDGLKSSGYSIEKRKDLESSILGSISEFSIQLKGKTQLVDDCLGSDSVDGIKQILHSVKEFMISGTEKMVGIESLIQDLLTTVPDFLDSFLAPEGIITQKRTIDSDLETARNQILSLKQEISQLHQENQELSEKLDGYKKTLQELRLSAVSLEAAIQASELESQRFTNQINEINSQARELQNRIAEDEGRLTGLEKKILEVQQRFKDLGIQEKQLQKELSVLEKTISSKNSEMLKKERELKSSMIALSKAQSKLEKIQIAFTEVQSDIRNIYNNFRERYGQELSAHEEKIYEIRTPLATLKSKSEKVKEEQKNLGTVNLLAPEEFAEVKERYDFLSTQLEDLEKGKQDLQKITEEIRTESAELFTQTFEKIRKNFHTLFRRLFGGGRAEIRLTEPDNVLESGIEILAQPPGKKLESINLLSGGERSLTAVGLLFATYMVKPSPFCLLDEIDAALDESNVGRFVNMLMEFGESSQFIVITHNKKTVAGAKTLLGVTMEESGISKVVSIRIGEKGESIDPRAALHKA